MYHSIDRSGSLISVSPDRFCQQMEWLRTWGWKTVTLSEAFGPSRPESGRAVVLTFDDGFANFYTEVFPLLRQFGMTATVFLVTDFVGGRAEWHARDRDVVEGIVASLPATVGDRAAHLDRLGRLAGEPMLSWSQIREMSEAGIEFGGHTASHAFLPHLSPARTEEEIRRNMAALADALVAAPRFFAYPYGADTPEARACLRAISCTAAFTAGPAKRGGGPLDSLLMPRVGIPGWQGKADFRFRLSRGFDLLTKSPRGSNGPRGGRR
jgi:peptidoglycan/xylan/chitin deacetylase (PgdA/CDA1 family)